MDAAAGTSCPFEVTNDQTGLALWLNIEGDSTSLCEVFLCDF
jgi:hypothetical protein